MRSLIEASAPVRICDIGGWTDTWFGGPGRVVHIAVTPGAEVSIRPTPGPDRVVLDVEDFGDRYPVVPGASRVARHPLLEAAIDAFAPPGDRAVEIHVRCAVPAGCGTGTSAAVAVTLVGALAAARADRLSPRDVAYAAHRLEVDVLRAQSGIQDQLSAAFGGINYLEIDRYPEAVVHALPAWDELGTCLTLVFLGRPHQSSELHHRVIEDLASRSAGVFSRLREAAEDARDAVLARDLDAFGQAMIANTEAQKALSPALVGADARRVIEMAAAQGAIGWKVNGAGGDGGSITILNDTPEAKEMLERRVAASEGHGRVLPIRAGASGLRVGGALEETGRHP